MKCSSKDFLELLHSLKKAGGESIRFEARGKSMEPYINDGEIVWLKYAAHNSLIPGDIVLYSDEFDSPGLHRLVKKNTSCVIVREDAPPFRIEKIPPKGIIAKVTAIERGGKKIILDKGLTRTNNFLLAKSILYFKINFMLKKSMKLFDPSWFVPGPEASLKTVIAKYNSPEEVAYHSQTIDEGLERWELDFVERFTGKRGQATFLDVGCGAGREAIGMAELGFKVTAIDVSPAMIDEARKNARDHAPPAADGANIKFEVMEVPYLRYADNSFDYVVFSKGIYSYIPTSTLRIKTLQEVRRILRPGGRAIFSYYTREKNIFSRLTITDIYRKFSRIFLKNGLHAEPGDIMLRYVSPASLPHKRCFCHFFKGEAEVMQELKKTGLKVLERGSGGYFIVEK